MERRSAEVQMAQEDRITTGGCLCGQVRYEIRGALRGVINCHCSMCQKLHGGFGAHSKALKSKIKITESTGLEWYKSSTIAQRGFCRNCGSSLFWEPFNDDSTGILAGSLDKPTALKTLGHFFVGEQSDFYRIEDELPKFEASSNGELPDDYA